MNKTELNEAIEFLKVKGLNEDSYIARNVKYFMNSLNNPDDDSEELALEFREQVEIVIKAGMEVPNLLSAERERCAIKYASRERLPVSQCQRVLDTEIQQHYFKPQINDHDFCELCNDNFRSEAHTRED